MVMFDAGFVSMLHSWAIKKSFWICFQSIPSSWLLLIVSTGLSWSKPPPSLIWKMAIASHANSCLCPCLLAVGTSEAASHSHYNITLIIPLLCSEFSEGQDLIQPAKPSPSAGLPMISNISPPSVISSFLASGACPPSPVSGLLCAWGDLPLDIHEGNWPSHGLTFSETSLHSEVSLGPNIQTSLTVLHSSFSPQC